jgi:hypothetical protein
MIKKTIVLPGMAILMLVTGLSVAARLSRAEEDAYSTGYSDAVILTHSNQASRDNEVKNVHKNLEMV